LGTLGDVEGLPDEDPLLGERRTRRLPNFVEAADLLVPLDRELRQQIVEFKGELDFPETRAAVREVMDRTDRSIPKKAAHS
jgi:hypothetical protein